MSVHEEVAMGSIGPRLRAAREARNLSTEQAADDTRISLRFIEALEREEFDALPAPVYVRGFLRSYANYLGLEPQTLLDELNGANAAEAMPAPYVRGPDRRQTRPDPIPVRREPAVEPPAPREPESEWDPEPNDDDGGYVYEDVPAGDYRARPVPGVLVERAYSENDAGTARTVMLAGIAIIIVVVALFAAVALRGGGGGAPGAGGDDEEPTPTQADSSAGKTVITVGSPTVAGTAPADGTPAGQGTTVPADGTDPTNTPAGGNTPSSAATNTPAPDATATETPAPTATATPTTIPPTPTPSPAPVVHPIRYDECPRSSSGQVDCGSGDLLVICGPNGWFIDYGADYPNTQNWSSFTYSGILFDLPAYAASACS